MRSVFDFVPVFTLSTDNLHTQCHHSYPRIYLDVVGGDASHAIDLLAEIAKEFTK